MLFLFVFLVCVISVFSLDIFFIVVFVLNLFCDIRLLICFVEIMIVRE